MQTMPQGPMQTIQPTMQPMQQGPTMVQPVQPTMVQPMQPTMVHPMQARTSCADCATAPAAAFSGGKVLQSERAHEDARGQGEHGDMDGGDAIWVSWISL